MRVLLPPSETKRPGGDGGALSWADLVLSQLTPTRRGIWSDLHALCLDEKKAIKALKLGPRSRDELAHNLHLETSPVMPALLRYTGVLYDALEASKLDSVALRRADEVLWIFSALFGPLRSFDSIPAYRLSFDTKLPGPSLTSRWSPHAGEIAGDDFTVDLRSSGYRALAPIPPGRGVYVNVVRDLQGRTAVGHHNKATKGVLVGRLLRSEVTLGSVADVREWLASVGYTVSLSERPDEILLVAEGR